VIDFVELSGNVYVGSDVMVYVLEVCLLLQVGYVLKRAGPKVVQALYAVALREEPLAQVAP
jgi:hypothetical protein